MIADEKQNALRQYRRALPKPFIRPAIFCLPERQEREHWSLRSALSSLHWAVCLEGWTPLREPLASELSRQVPLAWQFHLPMPFPVRVPARSVYPWLAG